MKHKRNEYDRLRRSKELNMCSPEVIKNLNKSNNVIIRYVRKKL